jgi:hypothetical protein
VSGLLFGGQRRRLAKEDLLGAYVKNDRSELTPDHVPVGAARLSSAQVRVEASKQLMSSVLQAGLRRTVFGPEDVERASGECGRVSERARPHDRRKRGVATLQNGEQGRRIPDGLPSRPAPRFFGFPTREHPGAFGRRRKTRMKWDRKRAT